MMDRIFVYLGTYTTGGSQSEGIYVYRFDESSGGLKQLDSVSGIENPSFLNIAPSGRFLYAVSEVGEVQGRPGGALFAYAIDRQNGALTYLNSQRTHGAFPCHVHLDETGRYALVSNYMGGNIALLPVGTDGSLLPASDVVQHEGGSGINPERQEEPHAHSVSLTPDDKYAFAADLGQDKLHSYELDLENGKLLSSAFGSVHTPPGAGPRHMDFHPNQRFLFLLNELNNTVISYAYDLTSGALELMQKISTLPEDYKGANLAADIHVHPNGRYLYASNRGHDSIVMYSIDESTGALALLGHQSTLGKHPRNFGIDPTGRYLVVANKDSNNMVTFKIDQTTGQLASNGLEVKVAQPVCLAFVNLNLNL